MHFIEINGAPKQLHIPPGVQAGSKIRVAGAGPNGLDLYLIISVRPHRFFAQSGSDLLMHYPVSETFVYHGGEIRVPLLEKGKSILVAIPPNTKDKQVFRFANKGFPKVKKPTEFGDFYLTVDLYDPRSMPEEFKKLLEDINSYMQ
jgi:molecular chaperone DnaJ